ncbi:glutathione S-transferase family protein [Endozoicomonas arenosclerae]|uniref:glutathione S-transferase family protein n=1 Tax=Endozoicomonas arenosclerae TaxID=1633495 RepID=UPI000781AD2C|nr:glutathione S-transferase family protein [Endozoicomonas arenosclerae]
MGLLVNGQWQDQWYDTSKTEGRFVRQDAGFRHWITQDGSSGFKAEPGRYHLYVSLACPWAHRTLIFRKLKQLESLISVSVVSPDMLEQGWSFDQNTGSTGDSLFQSAFMHEIYTRDTPDYTGRVTVPVLWDKKTESIVSNESSEIIRMFNSEFNELTGNHDDYYPQELRAEIDEINDLIYHTLNNGVYKSGFATEQSAYEEAFGALFSTLERLETKLSKQRYLCGDRLTEVDWRLFTTLVRFDAVYHGHFKCNLKKLTEYPNLWGFTRELFQFSGVAETVNLQQIKQHYYASHESINPTRIVPMGPQIDFMEPHGRS